MGTPLATRIRLKFRRIARELTETTAGREFLGLWPLLDSLEGWLLADEGKWLFNIARSLPDAANILEIGSYKGRSTSCIALGCRGTKRRVFAVDTFDGGTNLPKTDSLPEFTANLGRAGVSELVEPIVGLSTEVAKTWNKPIHFLFIDGSHFVEDVLADFSGFFPHVVPGGTVAFHDVINDAWPGVGQAWRESIQRQLQGTGYCESIGYGRKP